MWSIWADGKELQKEKFEHKAIKFAKSRVNAFNTVVVKYAVTPVYIWEKGKYRKA